MIEDLKETAACGMIIHYSVDTTTDMVTYNDLSLIHISSSAERHAGKEVSHDRHQHPDRSHRRRFIYRNILLRPPGWSLSLIHI